MQNNNQCSIYTNNKIIKISEKESSTLYINNIKQDYVYLVRYDGCTIKNKRGADFILIDNSISSYCVIELKGRNVEDAFKQIKETLIDLSTTHNRIKKSGIIVNKVWPKASTTLQKLQQKLAKDCKARLHAARHDSTKDIHAIL